MAASDTKKAAFTMLVYQYTIGDGQSDATCKRMMRKLLKGIEHMGNFTDEIIPQAKRLTNI